MKSRILIPVATILTAFGLGMAYTASTSQAEVKGTTSVKIERPTPTPKVTTTTTPTGVPTSAASRPAQPDQTKQATSEPAKQTNPQQSSDSTDKGVVSSPAPTQTPHPLANPQGAPPGYVYVNGNLVPAGTGGIYP